ncbi:UDP-2,4-diacetamido-2,4,6-trideoxy-beta-L-altropyranose hydrolase [Bradyrhizobium sp. KB893862 SZCCT0404]|uniref:UDP-2,4-diacetamido-2,4, 6-trideoxy-beta-L-altropyranose hydrolase n=1 Tax=Bradyrhizobium sp. KB893862 SZCCT0404 TaxID=2807672 RepID=UPI001BA4BF02|nr:UDP-2,4-diacetamido-2,4,6-trideoxy-beta-L-altropyranose hydrolase [Bradyrhizobium sp. KB893862 SZCCT0404]MBR1174239.1 UDP-2,4-diacetamido-2,4,6-trideoxy-beta-L-altropyranose hydrolase [Bradyrhizobium sp. KB893862 SZCCT0404]
MNKQVVFRVDASVEMGLGHLTRCLTLANALAKGGMRSSFLMRSHAAGLAHLVENQGHAVRLLPDPRQASPETGDDALPHANWLPTTRQQDAEQTCCVLADISPAGWLIVDHYALDARWERACRREGLRIFAIDDLADRAHDVDLLLDQNLVRKMEIRYRNRVPAACVQLLGPSYALLRPDFAQERELLAPRDGTIGRILICFGGSDPTNETAKALAAIGRLARPLLVVDVVIGASNPHVASIEALCRTMPNVEVHRGANNVGQLMRRADLAIGAGGVMNWERCCLGVPAVVLHIAANQIETLTSLADVGAVLYLGSAASVSVETLAHALRSLLVDSTRTLALGKAAFALVDGEGSGRVCAALGSRS